MNDTFDRNTNYKESSPEKSLYERQKYKKTANISNSVRNQLGQQKHMDGEYAGSHQYDKLEGQALKELAIRLASSEKMDWDIKESENER